MTLLVITCALILACSFLASSMEAALFSVSTLRVEQMCEAKLPGAPMLRRNKERIQDSIIALVILNNIANIAGSILAGNIAGVLFSNFWLGVFSGAFTFVIIMVGEVVPKTIGERHAEGYSLHTAGIVNALRLVLAPLIWIIRAFMKPIGASAEARDHVSEDEITLLAHLGHKYGNILESENQLIRRVFELNDILAHDIMTPRTVVFALQADRRLGDAAPELHKAAVSRIPVYDADLDDVIGVARLRDLLSALATGKEDKILRDFAEEVLFIPETARADALLKTFQQKRAHLAIVVDEYGGVAGVLTLEDILEQLVGEIVDEYDKDVDMRARARMLKERNRKFAEPEPKTEKLTG